MENQKTETLKDKVFSVKIETVISFVLAIIACTGIVYNNKGELEKKDLQLENDIRTLETGQNHIISSLSKMEENHTSGMKEVLENIEKSNEKLNNKIDKLDVRQDSMNNYVVFLAAKEGMTVEESPLSNEKKTD